MSTASVEKNPSTGQIVEVYGPTIEFLTTENGFSILKGGFPAGKFIPLHSRDVEDYIIISGEIEFLKQGPEGYEWFTAKAGDHVHIPDNAQRAWRNNSNQPATAIIITTNKMEQFYHEAGRPTDGPLLPPPPTIEDHQTFGALCAKYGYWNANPQENAAAGIHLG